MKILSTLFLLSLALFASGIRVQNLRCEYLINPQGIDALQPRLSWIIESDQRGVKQTACQILVSASLDNLSKDQGELWDSGKKNTDQNTQLTYAGGPLKSGMAYFWKVRIWDSEGKISSWSKPAQWSMGIIDPAQWHAKWIGVHQNDSSEYARPRYIRKEFTANKIIRRATIYATALGLYEIHLNGQRVGDQLLTPEWTNYTKRVQVQTYDVTKQVYKGANALGVILGNGWYSGGWQKWKGKLEAIYGKEPLLLAQLDVEYTNGEHQIIGTDGTWEGTANGPLQFAGIYEGVTYDARKESSGWDKPGFKSSQWNPVSLPQPGIDFKIGKLVGQRGNPIRITQEIKPVSISEPKPGIYVFAFDQNIVGWCRFKFRGHAGDTLTFQHGEMRELNGRVFLGNLTVVKKHRIQLDKYVFKSDKEETFEPNFTYHGFQYVEVKGLKEKPTLDCLTGLIFHSDCPEVGKFTCSEPLLNKLAENIQWSQRGNYMGIPTDCPQRNERCGYTGDAQFFMRAAVYNMDVAAFFSRWLVDVCEEAQMPDGHFADHAPTFGPGDGPNIGWSDAGIICPYEIYQTYGDTTIIREHYAAMKRNLDWISAQSTNFIYTGKVGNGDWLSNDGGASKEVIGTAYAAFDYKLMAEMASAIGEKKDALAFSNQFKNIKSAFVKTYLDNDGRIINCSQSGYALAFTMGLVPEPLTEKMSQYFVDEVKRFDWHPRTGFIGTPRLLPGLHIAGKDEDAYKTLLTKSAPSWLYPVSVGATTIWERWDAWDGVNPQGGMNSLNHYSFGAVGEYLYRIIGGISQEKPGYKSIRIEPIIKDGLTHATTSYCSIQGEIATAWKTEGKNLTIDVMIPANTDASVYIPTKNPNLVTESENSMTNAKGVILMKFENNKAIYRIGSGRYHFQSTIQ